MKILIIGVLLLLYGIAAIFSVSIYESFSVTLQNGIEPSNYFYLFKQLYNIGFALIGATIVYFLVPLKLFKSHNFIYFVLFIAFILQISVFIPGLGVSYHGARGWIDIPGLPSIQPAEFFKLGYVIFLSSWLIRKQKIIDSSQFYISFVVLNSLLFAVFLIIPDLGSVLVMGLAGLIMVIYAGASFKKTFLVAFLGIIVAIFGSLLLSTFSTKFNYLEKRLGYFFDNNTDDIDRGVGRQNYQALVAIGGGGLGGQGYGKGLQKFGYIPEAQSDFIFAAFSEELGFIGNVVLLGLYSLLIFFVIKDIVNVKDQHMKLLGVGILSLIIVQVFVNISVNTKILPNTGLTLPFISYGGTAIVVNLIELVLLQKIVNYKRTFFKIK